MKAAAVCPMLFVGALYLAVGIASGQLASAASSHQAVIAWRLAAWTISAIIFGAQVAYERARLRGSPKASAFHVALGVALGAFGLAAAANLHAHTDSPSQRSFLLHLSLVIWPLMTALPAFVVALVATWVLARVRPRA